MPYVGLLLPHESSFEVAAAVVGPVAQAVAGEEAEALSSQRHALARTAARAVAPPAAGCSPAAPPDR